MSSSSQSAQGTWYRVRAGLRNTRSIGGLVEYCFHAALIAAVKGGRNQPVPVWCWHSADPQRWPDGIEKGRLYNIEVIFAGAGAADSFFHRLKAAKIVNFSLEYIHPPEARTPALADAESLVPDWSADEICLEFITPLSWDVGSSHAQRGASRWHLDPARLIRMLHHRLAIVLGFPEPTPEAALPEIEVLASFAEIVSGHAHRSSSSSGQVAFSGLRGPIYLRGNWQALWLPLMLGTELQIGSNTTRGQGRYILRSTRPLLDPALASPDTWKAARSSFRRREHQKDKEPDSTLPDDGEMPALISRVFDGTLRLAPARPSAIPKKDGKGDDRRPIAILPACEQLVHSVLHRLLQPSLETSFLPQSIGARRGLSREDARPFIEDALRAGCLHVIEADVEEYFDHIDWHILGRQLRDHLPRADAATLALLERCIRHPLADKNGEPLIRRCGLLQGSSLSSLLANLHLHEWDLAMAARKWRFVRFMDDIRILTKSAAEADSALADAAALLDSLGLRFNPGKLAIHDLRVTHSFRFLGLTFGIDEPASSESTAPLKRNLYLIRRETWAGVENNALVVRNGEKFDERVPLHRVGEVVLLGAGGISTELIDRCIRRGIPVTFCTHRGQYHGTLVADRRTILARTARHHRRHEALGLRGRATLAALLVQAKLANYLAWLAEIPAAEIPPIRRLIHTSHDAAGAAARGPDPAAAIDIIRGHEGAAARALFPWINGRVLDRDWASRGRIPHERRDRWNLLLDTLSFLLFGRLNTALCSRGLDPWLGFLHSPENRYPSLIYDLMEPYRARLHRFAVWLLNEGAISTSLTTVDQDGCFSFTNDGWISLIRQFEKQLDVSYAADDGRTFRQLIQRQVEDLVLWVDDGVELRLYSHPVAPWKKQGPGQPRG